MIMEYILKIYEYAADILCPFALNQYNLKDDDNMESYDHFDEYTKLITITDKKIYNYNYNYYNNNDNISDSISDNRSDDSSDKLHITNRYPFKKSQSYNVPRYYCGFCSKVINLPEFMYQDKIFCTIQCRSRQIIVDKKDLVREHHSLSI